MAAVLAELVADLGDAEVYQVTDAAARQVTRVELAKPSGPAVLAARRLPGGQYTLEWRPA